MADGGGAGLAVGAAKLALGPVTRHVEYRENLSPVHPKSLQRATCDA